MMKDIEPGVILGLEDWEKCALEASVKGRWDAWIDVYYKKYKEVFDLMLTYLYRAELDALRPAVEAWDFLAALHLGRRFVKAGGVPKVVDAAKASQAILDFRKDYRIFLLVGIGQVGGTALPSPDPFLYIGMERWADDPEGLSYVVPHEFLHMVRGQTITGMDDSFGHLVLEEGLATAFSVTAQGFPFDEAHMRAALLDMSGRAFQFCEDNREDLAEEILLHADSPVSQELMTKYLYSGSQRDERGVPGNVGYYVGMRVAIDLLGRGHTMRDLVSMPPKVLLAHWKALR